MNASRPRRHDRPSRPHATPDTIARMSILTAALGTAFAAFCVWLTVRLVNRRERWAKCTAVILALTVVAYPLSFGPVVSLWLHGVFPTSSLPIINGIFAPARYVLPHSGVDQDFIDWYIRLWIDNDKLQKKLGALSPRERSRLER